MIVELGRVVTGGEYGAFDPGCHVTAVVSDPVRYDDLERRDCTWKL